jgi:hypothetical protein
MTGNVRKGQPMQKWIIPPIVIPFGIALAILAIAFVRTFG